MGKFVNVREDGIVFITSNEHMSDQDVAEWSEEYLTQVNNSSEMLRVLTYAGNLKVPFTSKQRSVISNTLTEAKPKVFKSAIYGMTIFVKMIFQVVCVVSGRRDIKIFTFEREAISWLNE